MKIGGTIILVKVQDGKRKSVREVWGSFSEICRVHELPYNSLKMKEMPFEYNNLENGMNFKFEKLKYRTKIDH